MVVHYRMTDRCTGTTVSGNRCKNGPNCHIHKDPCSICLNSIKDDTKRVLVCGHEFHEHCIERLKQSGSNQCPLCRRLFDVSHFKVSLKIVNTRANTQSETELPNESIQSILDGLNFDLLDFDDLVTEFNFSIDTLTDLQSLLDDIGVSNAHIDSTIFDTE